MKRTLTLTVAILMTASLSACNRDKAANEANTAAPAAETNATENADNAVTNAVDTAAPVSTVPDEAQTGGDRGNPDDRSSAEVRTNPDDR